MPLTLWPFRKRRYELPLQWERTPPLTPRDYLDEDGRRHRGDVPYLLPKDDKEIQRLDYQHYIFRHVLRGNMFAPVDALLKRGVKVLDVGCGTGRWGHEIARAYTDTSVVGFDLEEVPRSASTPLNYRFVPGNLLDGLPFGDQHFHYVHQRVLVVGIPFDTWSFVVEELRRVTLPNGWVELIEMGTTFHDMGPATKQFLQWFSIMSAERGIDASKISEIGTLLQRSGFSNVKAKTEIIPVGTWGGRLGNLLAQDIVAGWPTMRPLAQSLLGISAERFQEVMSRLEDEWNTYHTTYEVYCACGQV